MLRNNYLPSLQLYYPKNRSLASGLIYELDDFSRRGFFLLEPIDVVMPRERPGSKEQPSLCSSAFRLRRSCKVGCCSCDAARCCCCLAEFQSKTAAQSARHNLQSFGRNDRVSELERARDTQVKQCVKLPLTVGSHPLRQQFTRYSCIHTIFK